MLHEDLSNMPADFIIAKLDFSNAFNSLRRDVMLSAVAENTPDIYRFCHIAYEKPTHLKVSGRTILSQEGAQQCDPLGSLLFCLSIHSLLLSCKNHLKISYMDDMILFSPSHVAVVESQNDKSEGVPKGLIWNEKKCEVITLEGQTIEPKL